MINIRKRLSVEVNTPLNKFVRDDILQLCWIGWQGNNAARPHFLRAKGYQASATDTGTVLFAPCSTMYYADFDPIMTSNHDLSVSSFETLHFLLHSAHSLICVTLFHALPQLGGEGGQLFLGPTMTPTQVTGLNTMSTNMLSSCIRPNISKNKLWRNLTQVGHQVSWGFDDSQKRETIKVAWLPLGAVVVAAGRKKAEL